MIRATDRLCLVPALVLLASVLRPARRRRAGGAAAHRGVAMRLLGNREDAEDAAQDAMLLAYRHRASYRGDAEFTTWLYRVAATALGLDPEERTVVASEIARLGRRAAAMSPSSGK